MNEARTDTSAMEHARRGLLPLRRGEVVLAILCAVGLIAASTIAVSTGGYEFLFYIVVIGLIILGVTLLHARVNLSQRTLWALFAWAVLHMAGGMVPLAAPTGVLYNLWLIPGLLKYDQLIHAYGFGVTAWVVWQALRTITTPPHTSSAILITSALTATGLGAFNEVIEFTATKLVEKTNVGDYDNNAWDLVFNLTGAIIAISIIRVRGETPGSAREHTDR
ncbi:MAG: DUF2238 domain-containing protein [Phycisphaerales bacterium]|nr:DUF2238 domain-containing protein [Phycisphaerales bacterium]